MRYLSTKTYGHEVGLSCAFRQWRAESHCSKIHGYALAVRFEFSAAVLDTNGWVVDFGSLKPVKEFLQSNFDHKLVVARDDPLRGVFQQLSIYNAADVVEMEGVGCERFARYIYEWTVRWLREVQGDRIWLESVEVSEHGANSAIYRRG